MRKKELASLTVGMVAANYSVKSGIKDGARVFDFKLTDGLPVRISMPV